MTFLKLVLPAIMVAMIGSASGGAAPSSEGTAPPDLILHGGTIILVDPPAATAGAVALRGDRIVYVGSDSGAMALRGPQTRVVDLNQRTVIPGLTDAHGHVGSLGFAMSRVNAVGTRGAAEVASRVREAARGAEPGAWILGRGWDQNDWERKEFPSQTLLDEAAPRNPVALSRVDGHALWVNSRALEAAGIDRKTPDPAGGRILRDAGGEPSGILVDNATSLVESKVPPPDRDQIRQAIVRALNRCLDSGLTEVHDAGVSQEEVSIYKELAAAGGLPIRVYVMLSGTESSCASRMAEPPATGLGGGFLAIRAIKLLIDGALGSRGAALFEDYADEPGRRGLITQPPEEIESIARLAAAKGYQVCIHAIGDRGNALAIDALAAALRGAPSGDLRFRIEHAQILRPREIQAFKALGIVPSMQPTHCTSDMPWAIDRLGPERIKGAYAWRQILSTGAPIAFGSDFPVESENPFLGLYAAITRQDASGNPKGGWGPEERLTPEEALRGFTLSAAYAAFEEGVRGSIAVGKKADLVILDGNPLTTPVSNLLTMKPEAVIVDGRVVRVTPGLIGALPLSAPRGAPGRPR